MKEVFLLAGTGGQGVQILGQLLAHCANRQGLHVTMDAKYSGNMRGAPSNCTVIISDSEIGSPIESHPDHLVVFTQQALEKLIGRVRPGGIIACDSSLVHQRPAEGDFVFRSCPATEIAESLGNARCANIVMAGFLAGHYDFLPPAVLRETLKLVLAKKPWLLPLNREAFDRGLACAQQA